MEVALIGKGPGYEDAPKVGEGPVTWGVNDACGHRECDVVFFMDRKWLLGQSVDSVVTESVNLTKTKMYSTQVWDDIPTSEAYPLNKVIDYFGIDYFSDSCAYMIALAIYQGFTTISMYGFNYAWGSNYTKEKPCLEYWLGRAMERGITLNVYGEISDVLSSQPDHELYAYKAQETIPRVGLEFKGEIEEVEPRDMAFTVRDRVAAMQLLPQQGSYDILREVDMIHSMLWFKDDEAKKLNLRQVVDEVGKPFYIWDDVDIPDVVVTLNSTAQKMFKNILNKINKQGLLTKEMFRLYEKFVLDNK